MRAVLILSLAAGCASASRPAPPPSQLVVAHKVEHLDTLAREPMVVEHPGGALFVTGYNARNPLLWKSADRGATWARVDLARARRAGGGLVLAGPGPAELARRADPERPHNRIAAAHDRGHGVRHARPRHRRRVPGRDLPPRREPRGGVADPELARQATRLHLLDAGRALT